MGTKSQERGCYQNPKHDRPHDKISIMSGLRDGHLVSNLNLKEEPTTYIAILLDYN